MEPPAELRRLTGVERGFARQPYLSWMTLTNDAGLPADDQRLQAINVAYISLARLWLAIAGPIGFAAACMWSVRDSTRFQLMPSTTTGQLLVYRASTHLGRARTFRVSVDDVERASLRGSQRLELALEAGAHSVSAAYGSHHSSAIIVVVDSGKQSLVVIDFAPTRPDANLSQNAILVRETNNLNAKTSAKGGLPRFGNRRSPREQVVHYSALLLLFGGSILAQTVNRPIGVSLAAIGTVPIVVFFFRTFTYRDK